MNVTKIVLTNFKRFTELTVDLASAVRPPRLVLLIGANGSGKSSIFDAFEYLSAHHKDGGAVVDSEYFGKVSEDGMSVSCTFGGGFEVCRSGSNRDSTSPPDWSLKSVFYGRSSLRTVPELEAASHVFGDVGEDHDRPRRFIDRDTRFEADVALMTEDVLREVWGQDFDSAAMRARFIAPINDALTRIFANGSSTGLRLTRMIPALGGKPPDIRFRKGRSDVHYDLLSSGEKEVFNVLLNLFVRREYFPDAIYFIDEMDVHLHTSLQYALIREIVEHWLPPASQLWTASHSLGFIEYAAHSPNAVILDFDDLDFDRPQILVPSPPSARVFDVAVPEDSALKVFPNKTLMLCENKDALLYNAVGLPDFLFVEERDKNAVGIRTRADDRFLGLIDRDFIGTEEIREIRRRQPNLFVLAYYSIESYLHHPANLAELAPPGFDESRYRLLILRNMKTVRDLMLVNLERSRNGYEVIKTFSREMKLRAVAEITRATASEDFETFYPFLDMKSHRPGDYLARFNLPRTRLAGTRWMREAMENLFA